MHDVLRKPIRTPDSRLFTLIEMLTAMAIIVVLAGILMAATSSILKKMRISRCKAQMKAMEVALDQYQSDWGYYPQQPSAQPIFYYMIIGQDYSGVHVAGWERSDNGKPYIDLPQDSDPNTEVGTSGTGLYFAVDPLFPNIIIDGESHDCRTLRDPWGNNYYYQCPGTMNPQKYDLWSMGPDEAMGQEGVDDDGDNETDTYDSTDNTPPDPKEAFVFASGAPKNSDDIANWKRMD